VGIHSFIINISFFNYCVWSDNVAMRNGKTGWIRRTVFSWPRTNLDKYFNARIGVCMAVSMCLRKEQGVSICLMLVGICW